MRSRMGGPVKVSRIPVALCVSHIKWDNLARAIVSNKETREPSGDSGGFSEPFCTVWGGLRGLARVGMFERSIDSLSERL